MLVKVLAAAQLPSPPPPPLPSSPPLSPMPLPTPPHPAPPPAPFPALHAAPFCATKSLWQATLVKVDVAAILTRLSMVRPTRTRPRLAIGLQGAAEELVMWHSTAEQGPVGSADVRTRATSSQPIERVGSVEMVSKVLSSTPIAPRP